MFKIHNIYIERESCHFRSPYFQLDQRCYLKIQANSSIISQQVFVQVLPRALSLRNLVSGYEGGKVFSGGCRAGLTLERCSQLVVFAIQPVG